MNIWHVDDLKLLKSYVYYWRPEFHRSDLLCGLIAADAPISDFWAIALNNHDKISPYITERDNEVLGYLEVGDVQRGEEEGG